MLDWAGIGIIVGVQVATFLYTLRRLNSLQNAIIELKHQMDGVLTQLEGILIGRQEVCNSTFTHTGDD